MVCAAAQEQMARRPILTNAAPHVGRSWVLNIDLAEFFPSIHFGRVRGILRAKPFLLPDPVAITVAQLACHNRKLPQGAPTSPIVANIICSKMDGELRRLAQESGAIYTRHADDITFSVRRRSFPQGIATISEPEPCSYQATLSSTLISIIEDNGFRINDAKTRVQPWNRSQRVTGLIVNEKLNVPRRFVRRTRAMLHAWEAYGLPAAEAKFIEAYSDDCKNKGKKPSFLRRVRGNISYIGQIRGRDDAVYLRLLTHYHRLIGKPMLLVSAMKDNTVMRDVFICHASQDKNMVVQPLADALIQAGISIWYDKKDIKWGGSIIDGINEGLTSSKFVLVVISESFMENKWAQKELNVALSREIASGTKSVLPLMVGTPGEIEKFWKNLPLQEDKRHLLWPGNPAPVVDGLREVLNEIAK